MNIIIDIKPEVRAELCRRAAAHGVDVPAGSNTLSQSQLEITLRDLAQFSHKIPLLPDEAFSRQSLYPDHD